MPELPKFARFWMVCRTPQFQGSKTAPTVRFSHLADARDAAARLATETDAPHLILETIEIVRPGDAQQKGLF